MTKSLINGLLVLIFLASGSAKLAGLEFELNAFERWGYPLWFMYFTGVVEVLGGLGLLVVALRRLVSLGLLGVMIGAVLTHLANDEWSMLLIALIILLLAGVNARIQPGSFNPLR